MNIWDEKNYTEPKKSFLNNNENVQNDIMSATKNGSIKSKCNDIGLTRRCPECRHVLSYSNKYKLIRANKKNSKCTKCCNKHPPDNNIYYRLCPKCGNRIDYVKKCRFVAAEKNNCKCKSCAMVDMAKNRPLPDEQARKNMSIAQTGRKHTEETLKKMCGKNNGMYGVFRCGEQNPFFGEKHDEETCRKMRVSAINRVLKNKGCVNIGKREIEYFTKLENEMQWNGIFYGKNENQHVLKDLGYSLDYYEPNLNIVVEYDEPRHYVCGKLKNKDITRMNNIKSKLGCRFFRYNEKLDELTEY